MGGHHVSTAEDPQIIDPAKAGDAVVGESRSVPNSRCGRISRATASSPMSAPPGVLRRPRPVVPTWRPGLGSSRTAFSLALPCTLRNRSASQAAARYSFSSVNEENDGRRDQQVPRE